MWWWQGTLVLFALAHSAVADDVTATTSCGEVIGKKYEVASSGFQCHGFLGIPYAEPPLGDLRFKRPQPLKTCWDSPLKAIQFKSRCVQGDAIFRIKPPTPDSEDCLHVNIFRPAEDAEDEHGYPVMVFVHGGAFKRGSAVEYGDQGICENLVSRDVVVVTIQYRLGMLGFFSTGDEVAPGNWGIWDQVEALKWVHVNIAAFGGDSKRVTVFGQSAGGASVSILSYLPEAHPYYQQVIIQSGTAFAGWAINDDVLDTSTFLIEGANCSGRSSEEAVACLQATPIDVLTKADSIATHKATTSKTTSDGVRNFMPWNPRIDGILITNKPQEMLKKQKPKPAIIGSVEQEFMFYVRPPPFMSTMQAPPDEMFTEKFLLEVLALVIMEQHEHFNGEDVQALATHMAQYYYMYGKEGLASNHSFILQQFVQLQDDICMHLPTYHEVQARVKAGGQTWLYNFDHYSHRLLGEDYNWRGPQHAFDLPYMFRTTMENLYPFTFDAEDDKVAEWFGILWTNFAKYQDPTPTPVDNQTWSPVAINLKGSVPNLRIKPSLRADKYFHHTSLQFWQTLQSWAPHLSPRGPGHIRKEEL